MARRLTLLALAALLGACGASAARSGTDSAPARCGPTAARTLGASSAARVYVSGGAVYGCSGRSRHRTRLAQATSRPGVARLESVRVAGQYAGYVLSSHGVDTGSASVHVMRLSDGHVMLAAPAVVGVAVPEAFQSVKALTLDSSGAVAWIATIQSIINPSAATTQVFGARHRTVRRLDSGPGIDPRSLHLRGRTLSWKRSGVSRSGRLP